MNRVARTNSFRVFNRVMIIGAVLGIFLGMFVTISRAYGDTYQNLGSGDPGLLVGLTASRRVWVIAREQSVKKYPDFENDKNESWSQTASGAPVLYAERPDQRATVLYGSNDDIKLQCSISSPVYRCFPCGLGCGFVFTGYTHRILIMVYWSGAVPMAKTITSEMLTAFGVRPGERYLGEIDGRRYFWNKDRASIVVARNLENEPIGEWKIKRLCEAEGVVRGLGGAESVAVEGDFRPQSFIISDGLYDYAIMDIEGLHPMRAP
jgi:hypothetical protein